MRPHNKTPYIIEYYTGGYSTILAKFCSSEDAEKYMDELAKNKENAIFALWGHGDICSVIYDTDWEDVPAPEVIHCFIKGTQIK